MSTQIKYKDKVIAAFENGTITLHTDDSKLDDDLEIMDVGEAYMAKFHKMVDGSITEVTAEDLQGVTEIAQYAFAYKDKLLSAEIPDTVTKINNNAYQYCNSLKSVTCYATTPPTLASNAFSTVNYNCIFYVPEGSLATYKKATNWATKANYMYPIGTKLISFTVDGLSCLAEEGMTWEGYVGSSYNTTASNIIGDEGYVSFFDEATVVALGSYGSTDYVTKGQPIIDGGVYATAISPLAVSFTIEGGYAPSTYALGSSKTFQQLIDESYQGGEFYNEGGFVGSYAIGFGESGLLYKNGNKVPVTYQIQNGDVFTAGA